MRRSLLVLVALFLNGCACSSPTSADPAKEVALRAYAVPANYANQLKSVVNGVLNYGPSPVGRASLTPDGQLVVVGSPAVLSGVESLVQQIGKNGPPAPTAVEMSYWLVLAKSSKELFVPDSLKDIRPALQAISGEQGPLTFGALERMKLISTTDEYAETIGRTCKAGQSASVSGGKVVADIRLEPYGPNKLSTRVSLSPDQTVVLAETGFQIRPEKNLYHGGEGEPEFGADDDVRLYYVIRAVIRDAAHP